MPSVYEPNTVQQGVYFPFYCSDQVITAATVFPFLGILFTALRFIARSGKDRGFGPDDWLMIPSLLSMIGMAACLLTGVAKHVIGYPTPSPLSDDLQAVEIAGNTPIPGLSLLDQLERVFFILMIFACGGIKLSVLYFYRRIFATGSKAFDITSKVVIGITILWTLGFLLTQFFSRGSCISNHWGSYTRPSPPCYLSKALFLDALIYSDLATDAIVLSLPFPVIWRLHMSTKNKVAVTAALLLCAASLGASIARMVLQIQISSQGLTDPFMKITALLYWSMVEAGVAIIAISLPPLRPLFTRERLQSLTVSLQSSISLDSLRLHRESRSERVVAKRHTYEKLKSGTSGSAHSTRIVEKQMSQPQRPKTVVTRDRV